MYLNDEQHSPSITQFKPTLEFLCINMRLIDLLYQAFHIPLTLTEMFHYRENSFYVIVFYLPIQLQSFPSKMYLTVTTRQDRSEMFSCVTLFSPITT